MNPAIIRPDGWTVEAHERFHSGILSVQLISTVPEMYYAFVFAGPQTIAAGHLVINEHTLRVLRCRIKYEARGIDVPGIRPIDILRMVRPSAGDLFAFCACMRKLRFRNSG